MSAFFISGKTVQVEVVKVDYGCNDRQLISLAQQGDDEAFYKLINRYKPLIAFKAKDFFMQGAEKDDVFQECLIGFLKAVQNYKNGAASFKGFASLCVKRHVMSSVQSAYSDKHKPLNQYIQVNDQLIDDFYTYENDPLMILMSQEKLENLRAKLTSFSAIEKKALSYSTQGLSYQEIANIMGKPKKSIDNALRRARLKIREALRD